MSVRMHHLPIIVASFAAFIAFAIVAAVLRVAPVSRAPGFAGERVLPSQVSPGMLMRGMGGGTIYYVSSEGTRRPFLDAASYYSWYPNESGVVAVHDEVLGVIPLGDPVLFRPGARLVRSSSSNQVFAVADGGTLRWVASASVASALYGPGWETSVAELNDTFRIMFYRVGPPITAPEQYDPLSELEAATEIQ